MNDFSQLLLDNVDTIVERWIEAVRQDEEIESARPLPYKALRDNLPRVLRAMATMLSQTEESDIQTLVQAGLAHGVVRAEQGYDAAEMAREYRLVRWVLFSTLEAQLLLASPLEVIRASRLIDTVIDEAIALCFKSYTEERFQALQQLQSQLQLNNQELMRLIAESQEILSTLAHNLQTPVNSVIAYSNLFLKENFNLFNIKDNYPGLRHIELVLCQSRQFLHLLNDTLEFCRYELGQLKLQPQPTDVKDALDNVIEMMQPLAHSKQLELVVDCELTSQQVLTDALRLQQVVTNLVSNAIHTTVAGSIKVACRLLSDTEWCIAVSDTGAGIAPELQPRIFEPEFRYIASTDLSLPTSTGLGMAMVWRLVKLLQGRIEVVSQHGAGSTFTVFLPLSVEESEKT